MWHARAAGHDGALEGKKILAHAGIQMDLEDMGLSEINQSQKAKL